MASNHVATTGNIPAAGLEGWYPFIYFCPEIIRHRIQLIGLRHEFGVF
jgi:hypothetical protein